MNISSFAASGRPDPAEMREQMFKRADADGSGGIDKNELTAMLQNAPSGPAGASSPFSADEIFAEVDQDGDGSISREENDQAIDNIERSFAEQLKQMSAGQGGFSGSTNALQSLLDALKQSEEGTENSQQLTEKLLEALQQQGTDTNSFFKAKV